mmetsp:Transcript_27797/g.50832  ORF Transcript_27797/g.50832 Transcript_27797/m.50832 type:complete len:300 (+) Transcript_27797:380-1279(+)
MTPLTLEPKVCVKPFLSVLTVKEGVPSPDCAVPMGPKDFLPPLPSKSCIIDLLTACECRLVDLKASARMEFTSLLAQSIASPTLVLSQASAWSPRIPFSCMCVYCCITVLKRRCISSMILSESRTNKGSKDSVTSANASPASAPEGFTQLGALTFFTSSGSLLNPTVGGALPLVARQPFLALGSGLGSTGSTTVGTMCGSVLSGSASPLAGSTLQAVLDSEGREGVSKTGGTTSEGSSVQPIDTIVDSGISEVLRGIVSGSVKGITFSSPWPGFVKAFTFTSPSISLPAIRLVSTTSSN